MTEGMYLVNKQGTIVKGKTVKDENDQYYLTNGDGTIAKMARDKDEYKSLVDNKVWVKD